MIRKPDNAPSIGYHRQAVTMKSEEVTMGVIEDRLRQTRPDVEEQLLLNEDKLGIALEAMRARKLRHLTVEQVAKAGGLSVDEVSAIEAPAGELPSLAALKSYAEACGAKLRVRFEKSDG